MRDNLESSLNTTGQYATTLFTDEAIRQINAHDKENPMFMHLAYTAPHAAFPNDPLQVPEEVVERFNYIADPNRRRYAAMVSFLDDSIGRVVQAINEADLLKNSVIIFMADNGSPVVDVFANWGSNWPFRGVSYMQYKKFYKILIF